MATLVLYLLLPSLFVSFGAALWLLIDEFLIKKLRDVLQIGIGNDDE